VRRQSPTCEGRSSMGAQQHASSRRRRRRRRTVACKVAAGGYRPAGAAACGVARGRRGRPGASHAD
jgi:hypothetical protein